MSKTSAKSRYEQLMSWLSTYPPSPKHKSKKAKTLSKPGYKKQSRMDYYKSKGA